VSTFANASRSATDDFDLKIFFIPRRQDDFGPLSSPGVSRVAVSSREGYEEGVITEAVEKAGEECVTNEAGVGGRGGGASN